MLSKLRSFFQRRAGLTNPCTICDGNGRKGNSTEPCAACEGYGVVSSFRFHDMRHTYAALSLAAGVDIFTVSRRMGHSSITVTSDRYGHLMPGNESEAARLLDAYITAPPDAIRVRTP